MSDTPDKQRGLPAGYRLLEYEILEELGSGGFGITYLARDLNLHREVVIKENLPTFAFRDTETSRVYPNSKRGEEAELFEWSLDNFINEARTLARFDHPHIVRILRVFEANGTAYFVMPHLDGHSLDEVIEERRKSGEGFTEKELRALLEALFGALEELHAAGFYHRDLKPANVLMTPRGPVLIDFGAARQQMCEKTQTVLESAGYTPFEQMQTKGNVGPWSDVYGLGAILYRALTFEAPPKAMDRVRKDPIRIVADDVELLKRCSPAFLESIDRALAFEESDRPQSVSDWRRLLESGSRRQAEAKAEAAKPAPRKEPGANPGAGEKPQAQRVKATAVKTNGPGRRAGVVLATAAVLGAGAWLGLVKPWQSGVMVISDPPGALVSIAGEEKGRTPLRLDLPSGSHALDLRLDPWPGQRREIELRSGRRLEERFVFEPATLTLSGTPTGALVLPEGGKEETLPVTKELPPGTYRFEARYENWPPQQREVKVSAGERVELKFEFAPVEVVVTSEPSGAEVKEIGTGRVLGTTPLKVFDLAPGPVKWELSLAGHEPAEFERELQPGANGPYSVELRALMEGAEAGEVRSFGGIEMVWCPPGEFWMGSPEDEPDRSVDESQHRVTLTRGFWLAKYECTQAQWESVMGSKPSHFRGTDLPVEQVSWDDVQGWLGKMNEQNPLPSGWEWQLPTEAQWEYACRAGTETPFSFGSVLNGREANCDGNYPYGTTVKGPYRQSTTRVGSYAGNAWGLYDLHGNVWEWCRDRYGDYPVGTTIDPTGDIGPFRVYRGGSWIYFARFCRSAYRRRTAPEYQNYSLGFRPAAVPTRR